MKKNTITKRVFIIVGLVICLFSSNKAYSQTFTKNTGSTLPGSTNNTINVGDVDGDGDDDLFLTGQDSATPYIADVFTNSGGVFSATSGPFVGIRLGGAAFGDLDGDGDLDLVVVGHDNAKTHNSSNESTLIYINNGSGSYAIGGTHSIVPVRSNADVAIADVNGDGTLDVIVTGWDGITAGTRVIELQTNNGSGTFTKVTTGVPFTAVNEGALRFADVDSDNDMDLLIVGKENGGTEISELFINNGSGSFTKDATASTLFKGAKAADAEFADVNGDGSVDLLIAGFNTDDGKFVELYTNNGSGVFTLDAASTFSPVSSCSVDFGDMDGDGDMDLLLTGSGTGSPAATTEIYKNNGSGAFTLLTTTITDVRSSDGKFIDSDGDGDLDVVISGWDESGRTMELWLSDAAFSTTWTGAISTDWVNAGNWTNGLPSAIAEVNIPDLASDPIINSTTGAVSHNITTNNVLSIASGGSLIVQGTATGNITYNVAAADTNWHLVSSPVIGEVYNAAWITANNITSGTTDSDNRAISKYNNGTADGATGHWRYYKEVDGDLTFGSGTGYSLKRTSGTDYGFTGTYKTDNLLMTINQDVNNWNLVGNPYPSYLLVSEIIGDNTTNLTDTHEFIYIWDNNKAGGAGYTALTGTDYIHPGQAFFVNAANSSANNFTITESRQSHQTGKTLYRTGLPSIKLFVKDAIGELEYTELEYKSNATAGLDKGLDAGTFTGVSTSFSIYSHLVNNNEGVDFMKQSLPNSNFSKMVVPIGVKAIAGKEITFSAEVLNLPSGIKVFLEDRQTNIYTRLDEANSNYKITLKQGLDGIGRFYLHTTQSALSASDATFLESLSVYELNNSTLRFVGLPQGQTSIKLFNILGKQIMNASFESNGVKDISIPELTIGVYIIQLETEKGKLNKKIILE